MKASSITSVRHLLVLGMVLLLASCAKDELVKPCSQEDPAGQLRNMSTINGPLEPIAPGTAKAGNGNVDDTDGSGIGDDGDDLGDRERTRKKGGS
jgi:hypothetical protein